MLQNEIRSLLAEIEQLFMQDDFEGAEYVLQKFMKKEREEIASLKRKNANLTSRIEKYNSEVNRRYFDESDYVPYNEYRED